MARQTRNSVKHRSKNLTDDAIEQVVRILDGWSGKLTWDALIEALVPRLHCQYTRQALYKHERIKMAYSLRKEALAGRAGSDDHRESGSLAYALTRVERLQAENQRLEAENQRLLEQFVVWAYNAHTRGLTKEFLSQPLPRVNRDQSIPAKTPNKSR